MVCSPGRQAVSAVLYTFFCIQIILFNIYRDFQSRDLEDRETQEAQMSVCLFVCLSVCMSQTLIRFYSMNSSVNSFLE